MLTLLVAIMHSFYKLYLNLANSLVLGALDPEVELRFLPCWCPRTVNKLKPEHVYKVTTQKEGSHMELILGEFMDHDGSLQE